jgi:hypothetical protein
MKEYVKYIEENIEGYIEGIPEILLTLSIQGMQVCQNTAPEILKS